jgi:hypothetical protein
VLDEGTTTANRTDYHRAMLKVLGIEQPAATLLHQLEAPSAMTSCIRLSFHGPGGLLAQAVEAKFGDTTKGLAQHLGQGSPVLEFVGDRGAPSVWPEQPGTSFQEPRNPPGHVDVLFVDARVFPGPGEAAAHFDGVLDAGGGFGGPIDESDRRVPVGQRPRIEQ